VSEKYRGNDRLGLVQVVRSDRGPGQHIRRRQPVFVGDLAQQPGRIHRVPQVGRPRRRSHSVVLNSQLFVRYSDSRRGLSLIPLTYDGAGAAAEHVPRSAYLPFGGGRRICVGQSFALMEMVLMAAVMSQRFTFDLVPDHAVELEATLTLRPRHGLRVIAHRREGPAGERSTDR